MPQSVEDELSVDDYRFVEANQLGTPCSIHRVKPSFIRLLSRTCIATIIMALLLLLSLITLHLMQWHQQDLRGLTPLSQREQEQTMLYLLAGPTLPCLVMILMGGLGLGIVIPQLQSKHIVVCEYGLVQIIQKKKSKYVEIVRWNDIQLIRNIADWNLISVFIRKTHGFIGQSYSITRKSSRPFILDGSYQNLDELIFLIRSKTG